MAAVVLRTGSALPCKTFFTTYAKRCNRLYPFHTPKPKPIRRCFSSLTTGNQIEPVVADSASTNSASDDKGSPISSGAGSTGSAAKDAAALLDIRVGRILRARRHPEAESLYVEEVDLGEPEPRTICSGLLNYIPLEDLQEKEVIVLANLKPRNMRGVKSNGMLLAASDERHEKVELLFPPEGSVVGERIWFGLEEESSNAILAATPNQVQKKKIWELVQPHLKTDSSCSAVLGDHPMRTSAGLVKCRSLQNANIA